MENLKCHCCNTETSDLRFGTCFDCAQAESIISDGLDMYDRNADGKKNKPAKTAMEKLKFLIKDGWKKVN